MVPASSSRSPAARASSRASSNAARAALFSESACRSAPSDCCTFARRPRRRSGRRARRPRPARRAALRAGRAGRSPTGLAQQHGHALFPLRAGPRRPARAWPESSRRRCGSPSSRCSSARSKCGSASPGRLPRRWWCTRKTASSPFGSSPQRSAWASASSVWYSVRSSGSEVVEHFLDLVLVEHAGGRLAPHAVRSLRSISSALAEHADPLLLQDVRDQCRLELHPLDRARIEDVARCSSLSPRIRPSIRSLTADGTSISSITWVCT